MSCETSSFRGLNFNRFRFLLSRRYFPPVAFSPLRFGAGRGWRVSFIQQADAFPEQSPSEFVILLHLAGNFCLCFLSGNREHFRCGILGGIILGGIDIIQFSYAHSTRQDVVGSAHTAVIIIIITPCCCCNRVKVSGMIEKTVLFFWATTMMSLSPPRCAHYLSAQVCCALSAAEIKKN